MGFHVTCAIHTGATQPDLGHMEESDLGHCVNMDLVGQEQKQQLDGRK